MHPLKPRASKVAAHTVPALVSVALLIVFGAALPGLGLEFLVALVAVVAGAALIPVGERGCARVSLGAKAPRLFQRYTLAPVAEVLSHHGVDTAGVTLMVSRGASPAVQWVGRDTVVLSAYFVESVAQRRLSPTEGAAVIAHEVGVARAGLTRGDAALMVVLAPWRAWLMVVQIMWSAISVVVPTRARAAAIWVLAGALLWLGYTDNPRYVFGAVVMLAAYLAWRAHLRWVRARQDAGDAYVQQHGLAQELAAVLLRHSADDDMRDRAVRLRFAQPAAGSATSPVVGSIRRR